MAYFPMFMDIQGKRCLVVGGGTIALRKVQVLLDFEAQVDVIAGTICENILNISEGAPEQLHCIRRNFLPEDVKGKFLVVAATDSWEENHRIATICRQQKIPVNAVDQMEDCDFLFSSYIREGDVVGAFSSGGDSPIVTQYLKRETRKILTPFLGELAAFLGNLRPEVKDRVSGYSEKRELYQRLLQEGLAKRTIPKEKAKKLIQEYGDRKDMEE